MKTTDYPTDMESDNDHTSVKKKKSVTLCLRDTKSDKDNTAKVEDDCKHLSEKDSQDKTARQDQKLVDLDTTNMNQSMHRSELGSGDGLQRPIEKREIKHNKTGFDLEPSREAKTENTKGYMGQRIQYRF